MVLKLSGFFGGGWGWGLFVCLFVCFGACTIKISLISFQILLWGKVYTRKTNLQSTIHIPACNASYTTHLKARFFFKNRSCFSIQQYYFILSDE